MKKFLSLLILFIGMQVGAADLVPQTASYVFTNTLGLYQASNEIIFYSEPTEKAKVIYTIRWDADGIYPSKIKAEDLFVLFMPKRNFGLLAVTDETEDWVEVMYNNSTGGRGWIKKDDPYKFTTWVSFFNIYGKKYGLKILKGTPESVKDMHSSPEEDAQIVSRINHPQKINVNAIRGNWALVSVYDIDKTPKTGFVRWRADDGVKYMFPDIK